MPLVAQLAQAAIEEVLGIETRTTVWRKHLYELEGFKAILGTEIIEHLTKGEVLADERQVDIPRIDVRLRRREPYAPLQGLMPVELSQDGSRAMLKLRSENGLVEFRVALDFKNERLDFNLFADLLANDNGSVEAATTIAEVKRFSMDCFGSGKLQIFDMETGALLSRKDAFLPENMWLDHDRALAEIDRWRRLAEQRRERDESFGAEMRRHDSAYQIEQLNVDFMLAALM